MTEKREPLYTLVQRARGSRVAGNRPIGTGPLGRFTTANQYGQLAGVQPVNDKVKDTKHGADDN